MEIARANEKAYLNELIAYRLHFEGSTYDQLNNKLVEAPVIVSQHVQVATITTSSQSAHVVTTIEELKSIKGRVELAIVSYSLYLPVKSMEIPIILVGTHVKELEKHVIPKHVPLAIPKIGVGAKVNLIDTITHPMRFLELQIPY